MNLEISQHKQFERFLNLRLIPRFVDRHQKNSVVTITREVTINSGVREMFTGK